MKWRPAAIVTCVSIVGQSEGPVAVLTVAQWGQRDQTGVVFSLGGNHIHGGLRCTTAVREKLGPLGLTHQTFDGENRQRENDVTQLLSLLSPSPAEKSSSIDQTLIVPGNYPSMFSLGSHVFKR